MNVFARAAAGADSFQQRRRPLAFPVAVWKKFNDDQAGNLAALIAYYAFAAIFPLLLVLVTVLNLTLKGDPSLRNRLLNSALAQYPVIGPQINDSLGHIGSSGLPLVIGIVLLLLGARGVAGAMQNALLTIWGVDKEDRPGFPWSLLQGIGLVLFIGIGFIVTTFLSGLAGGAGHVLSGVGAHIGAVAVSFILNVGLFWVGFRLAAGLRVGWRQLRIGAAVAAVVWQVLLVAGGYIVSHQLQRSSQLYGTFGIVLGLLAWLYLQAEVTLYAAEIDVVLVRGMWPRSLTESAGADSAARPGSVPAADSQKSAANTQRPAANPGAAGRSGNRTQVPGQRPAAEPTPGAEPPPAAEPAPGAEPSPAAEGKARSAGNVRIGGKRREGKSA